MRRLLILLALSAGFLAAVARPASGSQYLFDVNLTDSNPRFNRPEGGTTPPFALSLTGTAVPYNVLAWYSSSNLDVDVTVVNRGGQDPIRVFIYQDAFDPTRPLQNAIYQGFQGQTTTVTPDPYRQYFVVVCAEANGGRGSYEGELFQASSGQLFVGVVPEPSAGALIAVAGGGCFVWRFRRGCRAAPRSVTLP